MRKLVFSLAAAGAALAAATPAAAQYYPQGYGYGGGYGGGYGQVGNLQFRIDAVERQIKMLDRRNVIRDGSADRLREEANRLENRLHRASRYGLNPYEANDIQVRLARLEQRVQYAAANRYGRYGGYGYNGNYGDQGNYRDHDRDRDQDRDGRWDRDDD